MLLHTTLALCVFGSFIEISWQTYADPTLARICDRFSDRPFCQNQGDGGNINSPDPNAQSGGVFTAPPPVPTPPSVPQPSGNGRVDPNGAGPAPGGGSTPGAGVPPANADFCGQNTDYFQGYCSVARPVEQAVYNFCWDYSRRCNRHLPLGLTSQTLTAPVGAPVIPGQQGPVNPLLPTALQGNGPLAGLGGSSNNLPQFGGPVQGGLGIGSNLQVPFFGLSKGTNVAPTTGFQSGTGMNVAGLGIQSTSGANWGGLPFLSSLNSALGIPLGAANGRKRRQVNRSDLFARFFSHHTA